MQRAAFPVPTERYHINPKLKAAAVAGAASEKKALDIVTVDLRKMSSVCDYFVIASGTSTTQVRAIADNIARRLKKKGLRVRHSEGEREGLWVLLDCGDVVAHVFLDQTRRYYDLERLWAGAPQERFDERIPEGAVKKRPAKARSKAGLRAVRKRSSRAAKAARRGRYGSKLRKKRS